MPEELAQQFIAVPIPPQTNAGLAARIATVEVIEPHDLAGRAADSVRAAGILTGAAQRCAHVEARGPQ